MQKVNNNFTVEALVAKYRNFVDEHCPKDPEIMDNWPFPLLHRKSGIVLKIRLHKMQLYFCYILLFPEDRCQKRPPTA